VRQEVFTDGKPECPVTSESRVASRGGTQRDVELSVVMPARNAASTIARQLEALAREPEAGWELVVADNGSTDGTAELAAAWSDRLPSLTIVDASPRIGCGAAKNQGVLGARGRLLAFCDADDVVRPGWVHGMMSALATADLVGGRIDKLARGTVERGRDALPENLGRTVVAGCNMGVRRALFDALDGFAEDMPFAEDADFSFRARGMGARLAFASDSAVVHRGRTTAKELWLQEYRWGSMLPLLASRHALPDIAGGVSPAAVWFACSRIPIAIASRRHRDAWVKFTARRAGAVRTRVAAGLFARKRAHDDKRAIQPFRAN
jgi:glycosyltransferase involved in cell wall biosynthesis